MYSNLIVLVSSKSKAKKIPSPDIHRVIRQISEDPYVSLNYRQIKNVYILLNDVYTVKFLLIIHDI